MTDRITKEVCADLRVGRTTFEAWLSEDMLRPADDRRFQFHTWRGRKRTWSPAAYERLREAIERESEPGGVLARKGSLVPTTRQPAPVSIKAAQAACDAVMNWPRGPRAH